MRSVARKGIQMRYACAQAASLSVTAHGTARHVTGSDIKRTAGGRLQTVFFSSFPPCLQEADYRQYSFLLFPLVCRRPTTDSILFFFSPLFAGGRLQTVFFSSFPPCLQEADYRQYSFLLFPLVFFFFFVSFFSSFPPCLQEADYRQYSFLLFPLVCRRPTTDSILFFFSPLFAGGRLQTVFFSSFPPCLQEADYRQYSFLLFPLVSFSFLFLSFFLFH